MKKNTEGKIKNKKVIIVLMEYIVTLGCLFLAFVMLTGKDRIKQVSSYAKPEKVNRYELVEDKYLTRVRPLTDYDSFKVIAESTLNKPITVYADITKTEVVEEGYITSGMVVEVKDENQLLQNKTYELSVIGDLNSDGDSNVVELTQIIRHVVGLELIDNKGKQLSIDFNKDGEINVVDITMCIRYIVYGELSADKEEPNVPEIRVVEPEGEEKEWYNSDVEVEIIDNEREYGKIEKTETTIEKRIFGSEEVESKLITEKEIQLTEEGEYKITSQSYGINGLKSEISSRTIKIDKTIPTLNVEIKDIDENKTQCKILIQASDNVGIRKYSITRNGEEERSREGIDEKEINGYVTIRDNGNYKVIVEDQAGNKKEEEVKLDGLNNSYTIRFIDSDKDRVLVEKIYAEGKRIGTIQIPTKLEDERNMYEFVGWETTNEEGEKVVITAEDIANEIVTGNKDYIAKYSETPKIYTIIFKNGDEIISTKTNYNYGDVIKETEIPEAPIKETDERSKYIFKGWKTINEQGEEVVLTKEQIINMQVEGNKQFKAVYEEILKEFTVIFKDYNDNELLKKTDYNYGEKIVLPPSPTRAEDERNTYEFAGWKTINEQGQEIIVTSEEIARGTVIENKEYTAKYIEVPRIYTVIFKDENGNEIENKKEYTYGQPVQIPEAPKKAEDETFTYKFSGWSPEVQGTVTRNIEYLATYEAKYKEYAVIFRQDENEDGEPGEILNNFGYHYGDKVKLPEEPHKLSTMEYAYRFTGWKTTNEEGQEVLVTIEDIENTEVTKELEYVATYEATKINYNLVFYNDDYNEDTKEGTLIERKTYNYDGAIIKFPEAVKEETEEIKYVFDSWKNLGVKEISATEIDIEFKAQYREEYFVARVEPKVQMVSTINKETGETVTEEQVILEGKSYLTLKEAVEEAGIGKRTIRILKDTEESVTIEDNQNITINLNGKTITGNKTYVIKTYGELTIVNDSDIVGKIIEVSEEDVGYGIYNIDGKVILQNGEIVVVNDQYNATGIKNDGTGKVEVKGGTITVQSNDGTSNGIENGTLGKVEITGGKINSKTITGTSYGINNLLSTQTLKVKSGEIKAEGENSYGIYNNSSELLIGEDDENVNVNEPSIEAEKLGIYVHNVDGEFGFYDGKIIGKQAIDTDISVSVPQGYKLSKYPISSEKEISTLMEEEMHIAIFWNEDKTEVIAKVPFKASDKEIQEPTPPKKDDDHIGLWTYYEIIDEDIEIQLYYVIKKNNGEEVTATDKNGLLWHYTYQDGKATNVYYVGDPELLGETVEIPITLDGYPVISLTGYRTNEGNYVNAFGQSDNNTVKKVILSGNIEKIDSNSFRKCSNLTEINMSKVTSIGEGAFLECSSLTEVNMPNVTSIGADAFYECSNLTEVNIPNVTSIETRTFNRCISLTKIDMKNVKSIGYYAFYECNSLTEVDMPNVTSIGNTAFAQCSSLTEVDMPNVTNIEPSAFWGCISLEKTDMTNVEKIESRAFDGCSSLTEVDMPNVVNIEGRAFSGCSGLIEVYMPNVKSIGEYAFEGCSSATKLIMPATLEISQESTFDGLTNLEEIVLVGNGDIPNYSDSTIYNHYTPWYKSREKLKDIKIGEGIKSIGANTFRDCIALESVDMPNVTSIGSAAFWNCSSLTEVNMPNVISIGAHAFRNCSSLTEVNIPNVTSIGANAFMDCIALESVDMSNVTSIGIGAFIGCSSLIEVNMSNVTSIGTSAFTRCSSLIEVNMPNVTSIETIAFGNCSSLTEVSIPNVISIGDGAFQKCRSLTKINMRNVTSIGTYAFVECSSLTETTMPKVETIGNSTFQSCISLTEVNMPNVISIGAHAFRNCSSLTEVNMPNVTSIGDYAFRECSSLTEVNMPNVTSIGNSAFAWCRGVASIKIPNSVTSISDYAFDYWTSEQTIYIEAESKPEGWSDSWNSRCSANIVWGYTGE